jgi:hypothetical protein
VLSLDALVGLKFDNLQHVDELVELLRDLLERGTLNVHDKSDSRNALDLRRPNGERVNVVPASGEQSRNAREQTRLVFDKK